MRLPDFGLEWTGLDDTELQKLQEACGLPEATRTRSFLLFRSNRTELSVFIPQNSQFLKLDVVKPDILRSMLPRVFRIDATVALPDSVPIRAVAGISDANSSLEGLTRTDRANVVEAVIDCADMLGAPETIKQNADKLSAAFATARASTAPVDSARRKQVALAKDLICRIAGVDSEALKELHKGMREENDAYVNGIIREINRALAANLNFPKWWAQDRDFQLLVSPREYDLVFTVRDRTGTEYSFSERSSGLSHFLSYYIQYLSYEPKEQTPEILLMDEPDAFLSSQGQQDLMRIFSEFTDPRNPRGAVQAIYVTHSPFLIDKNHAERIRVLEKGVSDEGTRVVRDVAKNHYEPLRSAFGAFVGETAFIGNCNLVVEGPADQILLGGAATHLRRRGAGETTTLDLNSITIVPAGSASHVHYVVYLARGRDVVRPAVVVLLDSDKAGRQAYDLLKSGGPFKKQSLKMDFVLKVGDLPVGVDGVRLVEGQSLIETEDLVPIELYLDALPKYFEELYGLGSEVLRGMTRESLASRLNENTSLFDAIELTLAELDPPLHIEKMGLARAVIDAATIRASKLNDGETDDVLEAFENNMRVLFTELTSRQRAAIRELTTDRVSQKIDRLKNAFLDDHKFGATREEAGLLFESFEAVLDETDESEAIRHVIRQLQKDHNLLVDVTKQLEDLNGFRNALQSLYYAGRLQTQVPDDYGVVDDGSSNAEGAVNLVQSTVQISKKTEKAASSQPVESRVPMRDMKATAPLDGQLEN